MEWLAAKPRHQFTTAVRLQDVLNRFLVSNWGDAFRCGEQEEIVMAQHNANGVHIMVIKATHRLAEIITKAEVG
jgi:hypothetical protein